MQSEDNSNKSVEVNVAPSEPVEISTEADSAQMSSMQLSIQELFAFARMDWRQKLRGLPGMGSSKVRKYWYNGDLVTEEEYNKIPEEDRFASRNRGNRRLK